MLRAGKKLLAEMEAEGRRCVAALVASLATLGGAAASAPGSVQLTPADSQAVPSSLFRSATAPGGMLRSQSTADTASTAEAESEPMQVDSQGGGDEADVDPAGYSSFEETDLEGEDEAEGGQQGVAARAAQAAQLLEYARDAVLLQPWGGALGAEVPPPAAAGQQQEARDQRDLQQPAGAAAAAQAGGGLSPEWKGVRRGVEWRARWLEHRLAELQHQRCCYQQALAAEQQREEAAAAGPHAAPQPPAAQPPSGEQQQQQQDQQPAVAAVHMPPPPPRLRVHRERRTLPECELPGLLAHPFVAAHSTLGVHAAAATGGSGGGAEAVGPAAMDSVNFPAESHAALDLLDQRLASLRRQLVALQKPSAAAALTRVQTVRVPGYRGVGGARRGSGCFTPRSGGATPRGTPRSGSGLYRDASLSKRRRVQVCSSGGGVGLQVAA